MSTGGDGSPGPLSLSGTDRLDSWKEIAAYLRRGVSTVQRWERDEALPTHRLHHSKLGSVYAYKSEVDAWLCDRRQRIGDNAFRDGMDPEGPSGGERRADAEAGPAPPAGEGLIGSRASRDAAPGRRSLLSWMAVAAALVAVLAAVGGLVSSPKPSVSPGPPRTFPLTSSRGLERHPALSPDGHKLAYVSNEVGPTFDVYTKDVESPTALRLTTSPESECCPAWSPDQRSVAFLRLVGNEAVLLTVPASGLSWSPDGRWLAYSDRASPTGPFVVKRLDLVSGDSRMLTEPLLTFSGDGFPRVSPDGRHVAFARLSSSGDVAAADVNVVPAEGGVPRPLTRDQRFVGDLDWTSDSRAVLYLSNRSFALRFWKVPLDGGPPTLVFFGGDPFSIDSFAEALMSVSYSFRFSAARSIERIALTQRTYDTNIFRLDLERPSDDRPRPLIGSSQVDESPQISPDGRRIAFTSTRSGYLEIWLCGSDGSACSSLGRTLYGGTPRWSPDGRLIAFDSWHPNNDHADIFTIDVGTREKRRITYGDADDVVPSFSRDGRSIYFASNRVGGWQVFRVAVGGGEEQQVTRQGGFAAFESPDGAAVFYTRYNLPGLFRVPRGGGPERQILDRPRCWGHWTVSANGLYVLDAREDQEPRLEFLDFFGNGLREIATLEQRPPCAESSLASSPDGRFLLYVGVEEGSDLARLDGLR
jgi:Tol biopolymer transport system component